MNENRLITLSCKDSNERASAAKRELDIDRNAARRLGESAVAAIRIGVYRNGAGEDVAWGDLINTAFDTRLSVPVDEDLPSRKAPLFETTTIQVVNTTTLRAGRHLVEQDKRPLALNFANGIKPGGGFLRGARAQEEVLCRSSALYATLVEDPMYYAHRKRQEPDSTDAAIYSPDIPVFRTDAGEPLDKPWLLSFLTCAAPVAKRIGRSRAAELLKDRIHRVLEIASAFGHHELVLGAWGCGAFGNDPGITARDFRSALEGPFRGCFSEVVFAITDWSPQRIFLGPFRDAFADLPCTERDE